MSRDPALDRLAANLAGLRIPGGCEDCDAYQTFTSAHGVYVVTVHHDDTCPTLLAHERRDQGRP